MSFELKINSKQQVMHVYQGNCPIKQYVISTGANGMGEQQDSEKTPRGWHQICEKYGDDAPENAVFVARQATGECYSLELRHLFPNRDWILTRILRLSGLEEGLNKGENIDSYQRFIYIHGTPDDVELGTPGSRGCIRMRNKDIIELYDLIPLNTKVHIE